MRLQRGPRMRRIVERPFEAGIADVDREEGGCHGRDYCDFVVADAGASLTHAARTYAAVPGFAATFAIPSTKAQGENHGFA